jgi:hypothetical protein
MSIEISSTNTFTQFDDTFELPDRDQSAQDFVDTEKIKFTKNDLQQDSAPQDQVAFLDDGGGTGNGVRNVVFGIFGGAFKLAEWGVKQGVNLAELSFDNVGEFVSPPLVSPEQEQQGINTNTSQIWEQSPDQPSENLDLSAGANQIKPTGNFKFHPLRDGVQAKTTDEDGNRCTLTAQASSSAGEHPNNQNIDLNVTAKFQPGKLGQQASGGIVLSTNILAAPNYYSLDFSSNTPAQFPSTFQINSMYTQGHNYPTNAVNFDPVMPNNTNFNLKSADEEGISLHALIEQGHEASGTLVERVEVSSNETDGITFNSRATCYAKNGAAIPVELNKDFFTGLRLGY